MKIFTPDDLRKFSESKYVGCVIVAKHSRKLHDSTKDSTQYLENKVTSESLEKFCLGEMNYEIVSRALTKKKPKTIFREKR